jgi:hypothetical protein
MPAPFDKARIRFDGRRGRNRRRRRCSASGQAEIRLPARLAIG